MIFGRASEIDKAFAVGAKYLAYGMMLSNCYFTFGYLQGRLGIGSDDLKFIASISVSALVTFVEAACFSALFDPSVIGKILARPKDVLSNPDERVVNISSLAQNAAIAAFCLFAVLAFWFDYNASISQLKVQNTLEARIIAAVFVMGGEILFGCHNVFSHSSESKAAYKDKTPAAKPLGAKE
jgi:hypothetical protein